MGGQYYQERICDIVPMMTTGLRRWRAFLFDASYIYLVSFTLNLGSVIHAASYKYS